MSIRDKLGDLIDFDELADMPLVFLDVLGEHALSDTLRKAMEYAACKYFYPPEDLPGFESKSEFSPESKMLSNSVSFIGPFLDAETTLKESMDWGGLVVVPANMWKDAQTPQLWIAVVSN